MEQRRILVSTRLFNAFLLADRAIAEKAADGALHVLLIHAAGRECEVEDKLLQRFASTRSLRQWALVPEALGDDRLETYAGVRPAGLFVCGILPDLEPVLAFARAHEALVFSPFMGDLQRGAHAGMRVTDQVLPVLNEQGLRSGGVELRPFFREVAGHAAP